MPPEYSETSALSNLSTPSTLSSLSLHAQPLLSNPVIGQAYQSLFRAPDTTPPLPSSPRAITQAAPSSAEATAPTDASLGLPPAHDAALDSAPANARPLARWLLAAPAPAVLKGFDRALIARALAAALNVMRVDGGAARVLIVARHDRAALVWERELADALDEVTVTRFAASKTRREACLTLLRKARRPGVILASERVLRDGGLAALRASLREGADAGGALWEIVISDVAVGDASLNEETCPLRLLADQQTARAVIVVCTEDSSKGNVAGQLTRDGVRRFVEGSLSCTVSQGWDPAFWGTPASVKEGVAGRRAIVSAISGGNVLPDRAGADANTAARRPTSTGIQAKETSVRVGPLSTPVYAQSSSSDEVVARKAVPIRRISQRTGTLKSAADVATLPSKQQNVPVQERKGIARKPIRTAEVSTLAKGRSVANRTRRRSRASSKSSSPPRVISLGERSFGHNAASRRASKPASPIRRKPRSSPSSSAVDCNSDSSSSVAEHQWLTPPSRILRPRLRASRAFMCEDSDSDSEEWRTPLSQLLCQQQVARPAPLKLPASTKGAALKESLPKKKVSNAADKRPRSEARLSKERTLPASQHMFKEDTIGSLYPQAKDDARRSQTRRGSNGRNAQKPVKVDRKPDITRNSQKQRSASRRSVDRQRLPLAHRSTHEKILKSTFVDSIKSRGSKNVIQKAPVDVIELDVLDEDDAVMQKRLSTMPRRKISNDVVIVISSDDERKSASAADSALQRGTGASTWTGSKNLRHTGKMVEKKSRSPLRGSHLLHWVSYIQPDVKKLTPAERNKYNGWVKAARESLRRGRIGHDRALRMYFKCIELYDGDPELQSAIFSLSTATGALMPEDFIGPARTRRKSRSPIAKDRNSLSRNTRIELYSGVRRRVSGNGGTARSSGSRRMDEVIVID